MIIITLLSITFILLCVKMRKSHKYWKNKNVLHIRPWPLFGIVAPSIVRYKAYPWVLQNAYNVFPEQRYFGLYQFLTPYLVLRHPDLIETIAVKNVENFSSRQEKIELESDSIYKKFLYLMEGDQQWKELRAIMETALSGDELKNAFRLMQECIKDFLNYFSKDIAVEVELKSLSAKFANDVIAATVFGYNCNSLRDPRNAFISMTKHISRFNLLRTIQLFLYKLSPRVMKFFKFSLIDNRAKQFYNDLINRKTQNQVTPALLDFFKNLQEEQATEDCSSTNKQERLNHNKIEITNDDILAHTMQFLFFGFRAVSTTVMFLLYELSQNQTIQDKLISEIDSVTKNPNKDITYESLIGLEYLDMVVAEGLRKWPPIVKTYRKSEKPFTIEPKLVWEESITFDPGTLCLIPIFPIHRDFRHYPEPDLFDPERFNKENRKTIKPFTYIPFGVGARNCIGAQFSILQIKLFLFNLLSQFRIIKINESKEPITLSKVRFQLVPDGKVLVCFEPRNSQS